MNLPKRRKHVPMGLKDSTVIRCAGHLKWVRGHECCIAGKTFKGQHGVKYVHVCEGRMEAHHVTTRGAGGGDEMAVPLCTEAHSTIHTLGRMSFAAVYGVDLDATAAALWKASPHGQRYRREATAPIAGRQDDEMESGDEAQIKDRP